MPPKGFLCGGRAYLSPSAAADGLPPFSEGGKGWRQCRHKLLFRARWARPKGFPIALWKPSAPTYKQYQNQSLAGRGGSVSRRAHSQLAGNRAQLTAAYCMKEKPPRTAATLRERGSGGEALLLEKRPLPQSLSQTFSLREGARGRGLLYREAPSLAYPPLPSHIPL